MFIFFSSTERLSRRFFFVSGETKRKKSGVTGGISLLVELFLVEVVLGGLTGWA